MLDRRDFLTGTAALAAAAAFPVRAATPADAAALAELDRVADGLLADYPENALYLGIDNGRRAALKARVNDRSAAARDRQRANARSRHDRLAAIDRARLSPAVALHVESTLAAHRLALEGWRRMPVGDVSLLNSNNSYRPTPYVVSQNTGAFIELPDLLESKHTVERAADAEAYLARLEGYAAALDAESARVTADAAAGVRLPGFLNDIALKQRRAAAAQPVTEWGIVTALGAKAKAAGLAGEWSARAARLAAERIAPALNRQADALAAIRAGAGDTPGMWRLPNAADQYAWLVQAGTTTTRSPEQIHADGLAQVAALGSELEPLLRAQGLTQGSVGARLTALGKRPDLLFPDTDAGRAQLLAYLNQVVARVRPLLPRAFGKLVPGRLEIRRVPPAIQDGAPNGYAGPGSLDGKTPGIYYINLKTTANWPRFSLPTLTFHEGIPGHIWQGEYTFDLPLARTLLAFNAYTEGYALYAEQLADELGFYREDPLGRIGYLQSMRFRAARLVADTGLHHKRWTMDQTVRWFMDATGYGEAQARSELYRYCSWPGQALGYKTGHNEINRLRTEARRSPSYSDKGFNDLVVQTGSVPLDVLGNAVRRWSAS